MAKLLVIDDSPAHLALVRRTVGEAGIFDCIIEATEGIGGLNRLLNDEVDVVLCDLEMPGLNGEKILQVKTATPGVCEIPILFVTASDDRERRTRLLELGACDLIQKPFHPAELVARLKIQLRTKRLHDELLLKNGTLARLSTVDPVTGLRTRRYTDEALSVEFLRATRYGVPLSVLMADLDHFKHVNDVYGHPAGDRVLRGVSEVLLEWLRATDVAGRFGGEEFLVILSHQDAGGARKAAERWRRLVERARFEASDGRTIRVAISVGVAAYAASMSGPDDLVEAADAALYRAKASGRNRVEMAG